MSADDAVEYLVPASGGTYDLMEATVQQVLPGGVLGPPMTLAYADYNAPEPTSVLLLAAGLLAMAPAVRKQRSPGIRQATRT